VRPLGEYTETNMKGEEVAFCTTMPRLRTSSGNRASAWE